MEKFHIITRSTPAVDQALEQVSEKVNKLLRRIEAKDAVVAPIQVVYDGCNFTVVQTVYCPGATGKPDNDIAARTRAILDSL